MIYSERIEIHCVYRLRMPFTDAPSKERHGEGISTRFRYFEFIQSIRLREVSREVKPNGYFGCIKLHLPRKDGNCSLSALSKVILTANLLQSSELH